MTEEIRFAWGMKGFGEPFGSEFYSGRPMPGELFTRQWEPQKKPAGFHRPAKFINPVNLSLA
jgi:hypothetical protein